MLMMGENEFKDKYQGDENSLESHRIYTQT